MISADASSRDMRKHIVDGGDIIVVEVSAHGWPRWTRISVNGNQVLGLREEGCIGLAHALTRCAEFIKAHLDAEATEKRNKT